MATRAHRCKTFLLTSLLVAWPWLVDAGTTPSGAATAEQHARPRSSAAEQDPDSALWRWFKEQDRLLDDILLRLARIEILVADIHRLLAGLPSSWPPAPATGAVADRAQPGPQLRPRPEDEDELPQESPAPTQWLIAALAGTLLLAGVWLKRRQSAAAHPAPSLRKSAPVVRRPPSPVAPTTTGDAGGQVEQALELAETMLSLGLGRGAAQTLAEQLRNEPKQALRHWLRLLEIYRRNGQQEEFERSAEELRQYFNVQPEDWYTPGEEGQSLEDYPHIAARLMGLWGRPDCLLYLNDLLGDTRGGTRAGFPQTVAEELLLLSAMLRNGSLRN